LSGCTAIRSSVLIWGSASSSLSSGSDSVHLLSTAVMCGCPSVWSVGLSFPVSWITSWSALRSSGGVEEEDDEEELVDREEYRRGGT
jgi:hypothetical protein